MAKRKPKEPAQPISALTASEGPPRSLEDRLQYHFRNSALLELALTHRSVAEEQGRNETDADNEQLEFLGDSILDLHVTELLLERFGHRREGDLTRMRAMLVSREALSQVGVRLQLGEALHLGADLEATGGRQKTSLLANAVEAVLAAIYRDAAPDGHSAVAPLIRREIFNPHLPDLLRIAEDGANFGIMGDWKSALQELLQARGVGVPTYRNAAELGETQADRRFVEEVLLGDRVLGRGEARNRKAAQKAAAAEAFRLLQTESHLLAAPADAATSAPGREDHA
jgi:ribonuclease III